MAQLIDVLAYLLHHYPHKTELSNARVCKMVYLADWRHTISHGRQLTDLTWRFDHYGPFLPAVMETAKSRPDLFDVTLTHTFYGNPKWEISLRRNPGALALGADEQASIDHVIKTTAPLSFDGFIRLVYSTYPIVRSQRYSELDLVQLAKEYTTLNEAALG